MSNAILNSTVTIDINAVSFVLGDDITKTTTVAASDYAEYDSLNIPDALLQIEISNDDPGEMPDVIAGNAIMNVKAELVYAPTDKNSNDLRTVSLVQGTFVPGHLRGNHGRVYLPTALRVTI